jgi:hypothetical protein
MFIIKNIDPISVFSFVKDNYPSYPLSDFDFKSSIDKKIRWLRGKMVLSQEEST